MSLRVFEKADAQKKESFMREHEHYNARQNESYIDAHASLTSLASTWKVGGVCASKASSHVSEVQTIF
jgi:hypothetical protein